MKITKLLSAAFVLAASANLAHANAFVNGGFENGTASGWTTGQGYRGGVSNSSISPSSFLPGGSAYTGASTDSAVVSTSYVDPNVGAALGSVVYNGNYAYRAEDTTYGGYASVISQKVTNYTDANIYFAWKAVLENGFHTADQSAELLITLTDNTTNTLLISRTYNAGAGGVGVDTRFASQGDFFYTPTWQIEQLAINQALSGHDFTLTLLAADCSPTGHTGYAYLDGFGTTIPVNNVPEPASAALLLLGAGCLLQSRRKQK